LQPLIEWVGRFHPVLVHFPVALILTACAAELLYLIKKDNYFGLAALFLATAAAWMSLPTFAAGFAAASGETFAPELTRAFAVHRISGVTTPMLAAIAAGMGHSGRRTGQVWEQIVYRVFLVLAAVSVALAGFNGGVLVHGPDHFPL
jgi:uncharacterized membrane protein